MNKKNTMQLKASTTVYRRVTLPVPTEPQNTFEEVGGLLLLGAIACFAAGAIARAL